MMILSSRLTSFGGLVLALAVTAATSPVSAVKCGDTITNNIVLTAGLSCDNRDGSPALIVEGPATLDLNGYTVSCSLEIGDGIRISGKGGTIKNGIVSGCYNGLSGGDNEIQGVIIKDIIATSNGAFGIYVRGNNNRLQNVTAENTAYYWVDDSGVNHKYGYGIDVSGNNNRLLRVIATDNIDFDISVNGNNNQIKDCYVARSRYGIFPSGINYTLISNIVEDMSNTCIEADGVGGVLKNNTVRRCSDAVTVDGQKMVLDSNAIDDSTGNGIVLAPPSANCRVKRNTIRKCGMVGLRIKGADANNFTDNKISFCKTGIHAGSGSNRNRLINNRASNNTLFDLSDLSPNCGSNVWKGNTGKGNIACTQKK